ncbi:IS3 family transposase [Klebsiella pneumoniae]|uniref:IS3 family transposase n=1 Tax=Klebsiella pneumoniae TaxID=573 RepID=UPI00092F802C|nr:hypothetical protein B6I55_19100 [Klebsiella pneumoniae]HCM6844989.1 IS3 family transposase [Klebsiella quasipneumoniae]SSK05630.1 transposase [Klebsiella pneumoniae]HBY3995911.1 hypothetical protein [Klebsiella pneumoniae]HBZ0707360.1 hypothetical protein [Klebsiella pneumoniae]
MVFLYGKLIHSLKVECIPGVYLIHRKGIRETVFNYIKYNYNCWHPDNACGGLSEKQFRNQKLTRRCPYYEMDISASGEHNYSLNMTLIILQCSTNAHSPHEDMN